VTITRFGARAYGAGVVHAPFVRAGNWVFGTGLRAIRPDGLMDPEVTRPGRPLGVPPQAQREAAAIFREMETQLGAAGSALSRVARLDQYYPSPTCVDPYHEVRKTALAGQVAPSTSVIVGRLLNLDATMDVQVVAATLDSGYECRSAGTDRLNVPQTSGYAPCLRVGDMIFVAGQLARDDSGNIAASAMMPAGQQWSGTRIKRETECLIRERLVPALTAAGSHLGLVLKAQVYLSHAEDLSAFWQSWSKAFSGRVPPTTVVPVRHPAFGTRDATVEINLIAAHESAAARVRDVDCDVALIADDMVPARTFDQILFVAGLMAVENGGLCATATVPVDAPFYHDSAHAQMMDILAKAGRIFAAAGSGLDQVVRALHFHADLAQFRSGFMAWGEDLRHLGIPFNAIEVDTNLFVPGASVILDLWGHVPR
jgi:enamine deaminase RidA (YjgF/YER057c/UK114 family)